MRGIHMIPQAKDYRWAMKFNQWPQWVNKIGIWDHKPRGDEWDRWGLHGQAEKQKQQQSPFMGLRQTKLCQTRLNYKTIWLQFPRVTEKEGGRMVFVEEWLSGTSSKWKRTLSSLVRAYQRHTFASLKPTLSTMRARFLDLNERYWYKGALYWKTSLWLRCCH